MNLSSAPHFGRAKIYYSPSFKAPCISISASSQSKGDAGHIVWMPSDDPQTNGFVVDSPELAELVKEMEPYKGQDPGEALAKAWLDRARTVLIKTFANMNTKISFPNRLAFLHALMGGKLDGMSNRNVSGSQTLFLTPNYDPEFMDRWAYTKRSTEPWSRVSVTIPAGDEN
jgi:hypothetical protein